MLWLVEQVAVDSQLKSICRRLAIKLDLSGIRHGTAAMVPSCVGLFLPCLPRYSASTEP